MRTTTEIDTAVLRDLFHAPAPVLSVYFDLEPRPEQEENAALRWQAVAGRLAAQGAGTPALTSLTSRFVESLPGSGVLAAFASDSQLLFSTEMSASRQGDLAVTGTLPHLVPLLEWRQEHPPYVHAVVDRSGADLQAHPGGAGEAFRQTVTGTDDEIVRNAPGGWSQMRHQHRAEDSWEHNAALVADELGIALSRVSARLLLLAGDVRAVQYVTKHLPTWVRREVSVRQVAGVRGKDGAEREHATEVEDQVRQWAQERTAAVLRSLAEGRSPDGRTVEAVRPTLDALARGQVGTLVVTHDPQDERTAWFGLSPTEVSDRRETLLRADGPVECAPLTDVAVRAAVLTGAEVRVLQPGTADAPLQGLGGLCRYV